MSYFNKYLFRICKYLIVALSLKVASCELQSPCPSVFEYRYDGANNLYGVIQVPNPDDKGNVIRLEVQLSVGNSVQGFNGNIELASPRSQVVEDLVHSRPLQYKLSFPYWVNIPPTIMQIVVNGNQLCYGYRIDKHIVPVVTIINLQHTLTISGGSNGGFRRTSGSSPSFTFESAQPSYGFGNAPKNVKSQTDFNPQLPKNSAHFYFGSNPFSTQNSRFGNTFYQNEQPSQAGFSFSPHNSNSFLGDSSPTYHFSDDNSGDDSFNDFHQNSNPFVSNSNNDHFSDRDSSTPISDSSSFDHHLQQNSGFNQNSNPFVPDKNNFNFNSNDGSTFQTWFTTTTSPRPPVIGRVPPTQVPRDSEVEDLPTVESNLVQKPSSNVCGISSNTNELLVNGNKYAKGVHPWLAALFMQNNEALKFICGTSLVSQKHVVTAAHCVRTRSKRFKPDELWVVLGRENIQRWSNDGAQIIQAESTHIHPEYQPKTADADIALIVLSEEAIFSTLIRPICLWTADSDVNQIVGKTGTIIGWGKDESGRISTPEPRQIVFPVVSEEDCLRSNSAFREITSNRTFCGGYRNNSGPCNGDSGSGFLMKVNEQWVLRGIVSMSLLGPDRNCDLDQFVVFTDAAKYSDWLLSFLR